MKKWLGQDRLHREIRITDHTAGVRVSLYQDYKDISSGVESTVEEAFQNALLYFDSNLARRQGEELGRLKTEKAELMSRIKTINTNLKGLSNG